jgi:four helix bundle protein
MAIRNCRDLLAWQKAMALVEGVYRITSELPTDERFGLMVQMRRAAVSIPSNIAEGEGRRTNGEYLNQLSVAHGSIRELETHLLLAERLGMLSRDVVASGLVQAAEVGRLVTGLANAIATRR